MTDTYPGSRAQVKSRLRLIFGSVTVLLAIALLLMWRFSERDAAEPLFKVDRPGMVTGLGGRFYLHTGGQGDHLRIQEVSSSGDVSAVADIRKSNLAFSGFSDSRAYFTSGLRAGEGNRVAELPRGLWTQGRNYLGKFLQGATVGTSGKEAHFSPLLSPHGSLQSISLPDGRVQALKPDTLGHPVQTVPKVISGETMYWVKRNPHRVRMRASGNGQWVEIPASDDLMASPLAGGRPTRIASGLVPYEPFGGNEGVLWWQVPRPFPDRKLDLRYFICDTRQLGIVRDYTQMYSSDGQRPTACDGRIYWIQRGPKYEAKALLEAAPGEAGPKTILDFARLGVRTGVYESPVCHNKQLYMKYTDLDGRRVFVALVDPTKNDPIVATSGPLINYTYSWWLMGDYIYYGALVERRPFLDILEGISLKDRDYIIYRIPAPRNPS